MKPIETIKQLVDANQGEPLSGEDLKSLYDNNHSLWRGEDLAEICDYQDLLQSDISDELRSQMTMARLHAFCYQARHANDFIDRYHEIVTPEYQQRFFEHPSRSFFMIPVHPASESSVRESGLLSIDEMLYKMIYVGSADISAQELMAITAISDVLSEENTHKVCDILIDKCQHAGETMNALTGVVPPALNNENFSPLLGKGSDIAMDRMLDHYFSQGGALTDGVLIDDRRLELGSVLFIYLLQYSTDKDGGSVYPLIRHGLDVTDNSDEYTPAAVIEKIKADALNPIQHYAMMFSAKSQGDAGAPDKKPDADIGAEFKI